MPPAFPPPLGRPAGRRPRRRAAAPVIASAVLLTAAVARGQTAPAVGAPSDSAERSANLWFVYVGQHPWSSRWALLATALLGRTDFAAQPQLAVLRPGLRYAWTAHLSLAADYTFVRVSPRGPLAAPIPIDEHRAGEQLAVTHALGPLALEHQARLEQRWAQVPARDDGPPRVAGRAYSNQGRYRLRATVPLHAGGARAPGWYVDAFDEPTLRWGSTVHRTFSLNLATASLGYRRRDAMSVSAGYLNLYRRPDRGIASATNHVLLLALSSAAPLRRVGER